MSLVLFRKTCGNHVWTSSRTSMLLFGGAMCAVFFTFKRVMLSKIRVAAGRMGKATHCLLKRPFTKSMRP